MRNNPTNIAYPTLLESAADFQFFRSIVNYSRSVLLSFLPERSGSVSGSAMRDRQEQEQEQDQEQAQKEEETKTWGRGKGSESE